MPALLTRLLPPSPSPPTNRATACTKDGAATLHVEKRPAYRARETPHAQLSNAARVSFSFLVPQFADSRLTYELVRCVSVWQGETNNHSGLCVQTFCMALKSLRVLSSYRFLMHSMPQ